MKSKIKIVGSAAVLTAALSTTASAVNSNPTNWLDNTISPVANPIYFEDPKVTSEVRAVYMDHFLPNTFHFSGGSVPLGGQVQVTALQPARKTGTDRSPERYGSLQDVREAARPHRQPVTPRQPELQLVRHQHRRRQVRHPAPAGQPTGP